MADKQALFAGRTGDKSSGRRRVESGSGATTPTPPPHYSQQGEQKGPLSRGRGGTSRGLAGSTQRRELQAKEAEDYRKQANKCLQKTMTRWNPDFFSAAPLFEKAGACFRAAGEDNNATAMFIQAGECQSHESVMAHASAAKDFREAALITERQGRKDEAAALYLRCAEMWVHADEAGRAADYLGRSAKLVEADDEKSAVDRYLHAAKVMVPPGSDSRTNFVRVVGGCEVLLQGIRFLASTNRLDECMQVIERYCIILLAEGIEHSLARMYLTYCVVALANGDYVKAESAFRNEHLQSTAYLRTEECRVEEELLTAFREYRPDLLEQAQNDRIFRRLETPVVRLARSLRIAGEDEEVIPSGKTPSGTVCDARARLGALKEKYGVDASSTTVERPTEPFSFSASTTSASITPVPVLESNSKPDGTTVLGREGMTSHGGDDCRDKGELFPVSRGGATTSAVAAGASTELAATGGQVQEEDEGVVDLGLGDLEATLGDGGGEAGDYDDGNLEAMIEAAKIEAGAIGLEKGGEGDYDDESEEDIDLT